MDISALKSPMDFGSSANFRTNLTSQPDINELTATISEENDKLLTSGNEKKEDIIPSDLDKVTKMTETMNKFVQAIDTDIQFKIHEGTNQLMVQVIDQANNKVLKEFPSNEFLDTIAAIRDYVGILLDKKV